MVVVIRDAPFPVGKDVRLVLTGQILRIAEALVGARVAFFVLPDSDASALTGPLEASLRGRARVLRGGLPRPASQRPNERLARLERIADDANGSLVAVRARVLAGCAGEPEQADYDAFRRSVLAALDEHERSVAEDGRAIADAVLALVAGDATAALLANGILSSAISARLAERGAGYVVVQPRALDRLVPDYGIWRAAMGTVVPEAAPEARCGKLPSLDPWFRGFAPLSNALARDGSWDVLRQAVESPQPARVGSDAPLRDVLVRAADALSAVLPHAPPAAEALRDPAAAVARIDLRELPANIDRAMSYDALHDSLKAAPWLATLDIEEVAVVLAHELVHAEDARRAARALGCTLDRYALTVDALPPSSAATLRLTLEDRAFRVEIEVARALGIALPSVAEADRVVGSPRATPPERLRATIARLDAAFGDPERWLAAVAATIPGAASCGP